MAATIDVYKEWLKIKDPTRPLDYYSLLLLERFEDDIAKIRKYYRKLNAHVRQYASGEYGRQSQELLNELAKAMLCLTDAKRKREYDATLGRKEKKTVGRQSLEELLLARQVITSEQLTKARNYAKAVGVDVRDALVQQKIATPEVVFPLYAEAEGLPFLDWADITPDEYLMPKVPTILARQHSCAPVMIDDGLLVMASPNPISPDVEEELRLRIGLPVRVVVCTPAGINGIIEKYFSKEKAQAELLGNKAGPAASAARKAGPVRSPEEIAAKQKQNQTIALFCLSAGFAANTIVLNYETVGGVFVTGALMGVVLAGVVYGVLTAVNK